MKLDIGGDFYEFTHPDDHHWGFLLGDATGHGVTASLVAAVFYGLLQHICKESISPKDVLLELNEALFSLNTRVKELAFPFSATSFYGVLNTQSGYFTFANAGHPCAILLNSTTNEMRMLEPTGPPLGFSTDWNLNQIQLSSVAGNKLIMFTDGLLTGPGSKGFNMYELQSFIAPLANLEPEQIIDKIFTEAETRFQGKYTDDVTVIVADFSKLTINSEICPVAEEKSSS